MLWLDIYVGHGWYEFVVVELDHGAQGEVRIDCICSKVCTRKCACPGLGECGGQSTAVLIGLLVLVVLVVTWHGGYMVLVFGYDLGVQTRSCKLLSPLASQR